MRGRDAMTRTKGIIGGFVVAAALLGSASCEGLLDVDTPSRIPAEELETPGNAGLLVTGAVADFECAFGAYAVLGGLIGEELIDATQTADRFPYDRRDMQSSDRRYSAFGCEALGVYTPLQTARASAENVIRLLNGWTDAEVPNRQFLIAKASAYAGYSLQLLGESFCSMAVSTINADRSVNYGGEIIPDSVFRLADARFSDAITVAQALPVSAATTEVLNMALVGRARARQSLSDWTGATADAAVVPPAFVKTVTASATSGRRENRVWSQNITTNATSVGEPYRQMDRDGDPRVALDSTTVVSVTGIRIWRASGRYPTAGSSFSLATGNEARLILAEGEWQAGNYAAARDSLNFFRARGGQTALITVDPDTLLVEVVDQRRRELFLDGHHLGDVIRYGIVLAPPAGTAYHGSGNYGSQVCLPLPDVERLNNPNIP
jgi:hypothetical protein